MKNYIFDTQAIFNPNYKGRGIGRYVKSFIMNACSAHDYLYIDKKNLTKSESLELLSLGLEAEVITDLASANSDAVYVICSPFEGLYPYEMGLYQEAISTRKVEVILYDLIPLILSDVYLNSYESQCRYVATLSIVKRASVVHCISENTKRDAVKYLGVDPEKTNVIFTGVDPVFLDDSFALKKNQQLPYIMTVSGLHPTKNLISLLKAFSNSEEKLYQTHDLVLVLPGGNLGNLVSSLSDDERRRIDGRIFVRSALTDIEIKALYFYSDIFVFPSLYEGFGLPPAEAIASGACVISSNKGSLSEVVLCKDALFDPEKPDAISKLIRKVVDTPSLKKRIIDNNKAILEKVKWEAVGNKFLSTANLDSLKQSQSVKSLPVIDVFTALPPQRSGVIEYTINFLNEISNEFNIRLFYPINDRVQTFKLNKEIRTYPIGLAETIMGPAKNRFFVLGNSDAYIEIYDFALNHDGNLWLHDARYSGLVYAKCFLRENTGWDGVEQVTRFQDDPIYQKRTSDPGAMGATGALFVRPLLTKQRSKIIVHNNIAERYVKLEMLGLRSQTIQKLSLGVFSQRSEPKLWPKNTETLNVITLGFVSPGKMPESVLEVCGVLSRERPVKLTYCGQISDLDTQNLLQLSKKYPSLELVFTGFQNMEQYRETIKESHLAIQLRLEYNGESSATLLDLLLGGVVTLTNLPNYDKSLFECLLTVDHSLKGRALIESLLEVMKVEPVVNSSQYKNFLESRSVESLSKEIFSEC